MITILVGLKPKLVSYVSSDHADGGAHFPDDLVRRIMVDVGCGDADRATGALHLSPQSSQDLQHVVGIRNIGDTTDDAGFISKQGCGENRKRCVFGAGYVDNALQG